MTTSDSQKPKQSYLGGLGVNVSPAGLPYWKPTRHPTAVRVVAARKPTPAEVSKKLPDGTDLLVLAVLDIERDGAPYRWEVSSKRLLEALDRYFTTSQAPPCDVTVATVGTGTGTQYRVAKVSPPAAPLATGKLAAKCDAPGCELELSHHGRHQTLAAKP